LQFFFKKKKHPRPVSVPPAIQFHVIPMRAIWSRSRISEADSAKATNAHREHRSHCARKVGLRANWSKLDLLLIEKITPSGRGFSSSNRRPSHIRYFSAGRN
jgi:hypothetical protein